MKCPKCQGALEFVRVEMIPWYYPLTDDGVINYDGGDQGESWGEEDSYLQCAYCYARFEYEYADENPDKVFLGEEKQ